MWKKLYIFTVCFQNDIYLNFCNHNITAKETPSQLPVMLHLMASISKMWIISLTIGRRLDNCRSNKQRKVKDTVRQCRSSLHANWWEKLLITHFHIDHSKMIHGNSLCRFCQTILTVKHFLVWFCGTERCE